MPPSALKDSEIPIDVSLPKALMDPPEQGASRGF